MLLLLITVVIVILFYKYLIKPMDYWKTLNVPYVKPTVLFGNFLDAAIYRRCFCYTMRDAYEQFKSKRYFGMFQFTTPILIVKDIELIKKITIKDFDHFIDHSNHSKEDVDPMWSKNLFAIRGERWRDLRATLSPAFTGSKMRNMFVLINDCCKNFVNFFYEGKEETITVEMKDIFTRLTNDCIANCAFGIKCDSLKNKDNEFYVRGRKAFDFNGAKGLLFLMYSACPKIMKLLGLKFFTTDMVNFFQGVIDETIALRETKGIVRPDMIQLLLQARKGQLTNEDNSKVVQDSFSTAQEYISASKSKRFVELTNEDIAANALIFFFGGFDTTSYLMYFTAYELAVNQDIQDRLIEEVETTLQECNGELTYDALMKMEYMDMVLSETMRKWPIAVFVDRICTKEYTIEPELPGEMPLKIQKDQGVWYPVFAVHRDPEYWPDPEKFDPERFNSTNRHKINPITYCPFGLGPRNCIGSRFALMENKAIIFHILTKFRIVPVEKTVIPLVLSTKSIILNAEGGMWLGFQKRK